MNLAIFDLDNTLLAGDSDHAWGEFIVSKGLVKPEFYSAENDRFYREYQQGTLDIIEYQRFVLTPISQIPAQQRTELHQQFMSEVITKMRLPKADHLIQQHRSAGDTLLVITATNRFIVEPIVAALGIPNLLATEPEEIDGKMTGGVAGIPCFQEGKIQRLKNWLAEQGNSFTQTTFYSDSINDAPLLHHADVAVAVDPDDRLRQLAEEQSWPIISLR